MVFGETAGAAVRARGGARGGDKCWWDKELGAALEGGAGPKRGAMGARPSDARVCGERGYDFVREVEARVVEGWRRGGLEAENW